MAEDHKPRAGAKNPIQILLVFAFFALMALLNVRAFWTVKDHVLAGYGDFANLYASALIVRQGEGDRLYDITKQREVQSLIFSRVESRQEALPFLHLAYETLIYVPLTYLSYPAAVSVWVCLNFALLIAFSVVMPRFLPYARSALPITWILPIIGYFPVLLTLIQGQEGVLLLCLYTLAFVCFRTGKHTLAGCMLALALFKFHLVIPLVIVFLVYRQWKFIAGFFAASFFPVIISLYIVGLRGSLDYLQLLARFGKTQENTGGGFAFEIQPSKMPNLRGVLFSLFRSELPEVYVVALVVLTTLCLLAWSATVSRRATIDVRFALATMVSLSASYYLFTYDLTLAILPNLILFNLLWTPTVRELRIHKRAFLLCNLVLMTSPIHFLMLVYAIDPSVMALPILSLAFVIAKLPLTLSASYQRSEQCLANDAGAVPE
jgi:Glycosyltransferase family 87